MLTLFQIILVVSGICGFLTHTPIKDLPMSVREAQVDLSESCMRVCTYPTFAIANAVNGTGYDQKLVVAVPVMGAFIANNFMCHLPCNAYARLNLEAQIKEERRRTMSKELHEAFAQLNRKKQFTYSVQKVKKYRVRIKRKAGK